MRPVSNYYKQKIASGETRNFHIKVMMTLADGTQYDDVHNPAITEADIMDSSFKILTASSGQSSFDIGSAIIGKCQFTLKNFEDEWARVDFFNAEATVWIGLDGDETHGAINYLRMGFFTVDEPQYAGSMVSLELLDNMWKFDKELPTIVYPRTIGQIVNDLCTHCGVGLYSQSFDGSDYEIQSAPEQEMNCREYLQYLAMIGCNFCVMTDTGALRIKWYASSSRPSDDLDGGSFSTETTPYSDGDSADGGNFTNYNSGDDYDGGTFTENGNVAYFTRLFNRTVGTDILTITGVKIKIGETDYLIGQEGYVLIIENPLVNENNVNAILSRIWNKLERFTFRTYSVTALPDIAPEVGDCVAVSYKGTMVYSYLTNYTFTPSLSTASLGAVTPTRALSQRYSKAVQTAVEVARQRVDREIGVYDLTAQRMNQLAMNALGVYTDYDDMPTGGRIYYLCNAPITKNAQTGMCEFPETSVVYKTTGDGFFISTSVDPVTHARIWTQGFSPSTGLLVELLTALRINAEQLYTGQLTVGGSQIGVTKPYIRVLDTSNNPICYLDYRGITMYKGLIQSPDFAEETPVGTYAASGMSIDVNNATLKSEYFALNALGAFLKGTIEAVGGHIGAATITQHDITVRGDIEIYKGSGTFKFKPTDYYFAQDFSLLLKTDSGTSTVSITLHQNDTDTPVGTYTATTEGVTTSVLNHLIGTNENDYYSVTVSASTAISAEDVILAYMGERGFEGTLKGIFKGHIDATGNFKGHVEAENGSTIGSYEFDGSDIYNGNMLFNPSDYVYYNLSNNKAEGWDNNGKYTVKTVSNGSFGHVFALYAASEPPYDYTDVDDAVPRITHYLNSDSGGNKTASIFKEDSNGATEVLWSNNPTVLRTSDYNATTIDIGEGQSMGNYKFWLVYE